MRFPPAPRASVILGILTSVLALLWVGFFLWGRHVSTEQWSKWLPGMNMLGPQAPEWAAHIAGKFLIVLTLLLGCAAVIVRFWKTLSRPDVAASLVSTAVTLAVSCVLFEDLAFRGVKAPWYDVQAIMTHPETVSVFGQRLLLIWPAMLLKNLVPRLGYMTCFILIQGLAIFLAVYAFGQWSALFVGQKLKGVGQVLMAAWVLPNAGFFQAHDIGVVLTYTLCFIFLYRKQYWLLVPAFCLGILNHQNILLLVPTAVVALWGRERRSTIGALALIMTAAYFSIQYILNVTIPIPVTHEYIIWANMDQLTSLPQTMIFSLMLTVPWFVGAAAAFRKADPFLKRVSILLPMQIGMYFVFGRMNEPRLYHGFLPVLIGIYLCHFRAYFAESSSEVLPTRDQWSIVEMRA